MSIDAHQFREMVHTTLRSFVVPYSIEAEILLLMTAAHESRLGEYLRQIRGPARGAWQMEPTTLDDHYSWLGARPEILAAVEGLKPPRLTRVEALMGCLPYACVMARVHYRRKPGALPTDLDGMAKYAKKFYNSELGAATPGDYKRAYLEFYGALK